MNLETTVIDRLLLAKSLLSKLSSYSGAELGQQDLAYLILIAHDAAELAIAAVADQIGKLPTKKDSSFLKYFKKIQEEHPESNVAGFGFAKKLNEARNSLKHSGIRPDRDQFKEVVEETYHFVSQWCGKYLHISFDDLDSSSLIVDTTIKHLYNSARDAHEGGEHKKCLEYISEGLAILFYSKVGLWNVKVGKPDSADAIKLAAYGVHANEYLTLQEYIPQATKTYDTPVAIKWKQNPYGHPANWRPARTAFCLGVFLETVLRVQGAEIIPATIDSKVVYECRVTALTDKTELWAEMVETTKNGTVLSSLAVLGGGNTVRSVVKSLNMGEQIRCRVTAIREIPGTRHSPEEAVRTLEIYNKDIYEGAFYVDPAQVKVTLVPQDTDFVKEVFPDLPETDWIP